MYVQQVTSELYRLRIAAGFEAGHVHGRKVGEENERKQKEEKVSEANQ